MSRYDRWRELRQRHFPDLPFDCGNRTEPGVRYSVDLRDWSAKATTPDQRRIENYIDRFDLRAKRVLHIGIGNSGLASRLHGRVGEIVGTTIDEPEMEVARSLGFRNYSFVLHNKFSGPSDLVEGTFDFIIDNNPTSPCCCIRHFADMLDFYAAKLAPGGQIVTDQEGLGWVPDETNPRWSFDFDDLAAAGAAADFRAFRANRSVYVLSRSAPTPPGWRSISSHWLRRARALPGAIVRKGPRAVARIARKWIKSGVCAVLAALPSRDRLKKPELMNAANDQRRIPNLFIVGAPKCGTTAWFEYLGAHPDIFFPDSKEDCFFATDLPRFRFVHSEAEYSKLFANKGDAKIVGEASAMYLFSEAAATGIRDYNPEAKILIFLREQEDYLPSLHNQFLREFSEEIEDFETAWRLSGKRPPETIPATCLEPRTLDYAAMGRFSEQVARYLDAFPAEQVRVIQFREWTADPRATYLRILDFLGVEDDGRTEFAPVNPGVTYRSRGLVRFILFPPTFARKIARLVKQILGLKGHRIYPMVHRTVNLLSATGYKKELDSSLRDEIRGYYADDNWRLEDRLRAGGGQLKRVSGMSST